MEGRVLALDLGEKRIGIAVSDPGRMLSKPLCVIAHSNIEEDCHKIMEIANANGVVTLVIGQALGPNGEDTPSSRHASRVAEMLQQITEIEIKFWDESFSTQDAHKNQLQLGAQKKKRSGHLDEIAAAIFLQDYLDQGNVSKL